MLSQKHVDKMKINCLFRRGENENVKQIKNSGRKANLKLIKVQNVEKNI